MESIQKRFDTNSDSTFSVR